jgi:hypothetical protein
LVAVLALRELVASRASAARRSAGGGGIFRVPGTSQVSRCPLRGQTGSQRDPVHQKKVAIIFPRHVGGNEEGRIKNGRSSRRRRKEMTIIFPGHMTKRGKVV